MDPFFLPIQISTPAEKIRYPQKIFLSGSCFTEHIGHQLMEMKFDVMQNPNGILFDPLSVASSLISYLKPEMYKPEDLFFHNELWQSWNHHGHFSDTSRQSILNNINHSQQAAHSFLKGADWLIITLGSAFHYVLKEENRPVANCHRAPANWFTKKLLSVEDMLAVLDEALHRILDFNPQLQIVFTISPVRHIRDGVIENNRSKARLIEVTHQLVNKFNRTNYFPAYELVIDVLRDYRFYDKDLVHPNFMATTYVVENFMDHYMHPEARLLAEEIKKLQISRKHRALHPATVAHRKFLKDQYVKTLTLAEKYAFLDLKEELMYFSGDGE
ncbi:MAG: GSCFA domain-containing protein [Bacteroidota bacterium]|nr:GSCFA domain-containing protein [Bacteroidota bacterium]